MQMRWGGNSVHVNMVVTSMAWSNLSSTKNMSTSMLWPMKRVNSRFSGCDTVGCSAKGKQTTSVPTMIKWWGIGDVGLGAFGTMERISMVTTTKHKSIRLHTAPLKIMASTSSHFQWIGYGTSSSSVRILSILVAVFLWVDVRRYT